MAPLEKPRSPERRLDIRSIEGRIRAVLITVRSDGVSEEELIDQPFEGGLMDGLTVATQYAANKLSLRVLDLTD